MMLLPAVFCLCKYWNISGVIRRCFKRSLFAALCGELCVPLSPTVKKMTELKSRGVKMLPSKDNQHKISVCKSLIPAAFHIPSEKKTRVLFHFSYLKIFD